MAVNAVQNVFNNAYAFGNNQITYYNTLADNTWEAKVNGLRYEAVRRQFPFPAFVIAPEYYFPDKTKADLVVPQLHPGTPGDLRPVFVYEGKEGTGNQTADRTALKLAMTQVWNHYLKSMTKAPALRGSQFGMAASGRYVAFVSFDKSDGSASRDIVQANASLGAQTTYTKSTEQNRGVYWNGRADAATIDGILGNIHQAIIAIL
jgi:hypothetical protein